MNARKCDRCKKLYEEYNTANCRGKYNAIIFANVDYKNDRFTHGNVDLCPECMSILCTWLFDNTELEECEE